MRHSIIVSVLAITLIFTCKIFSQNVEFDKKNFPGIKDQLKAALKELSLGDELYDLALVPNSGNFALALDYYLKAQDFNPNNALLNFKIGRCYLNSFNKTKSISYFETALKLDAKVNLEIHYLMGQAYQLNLEFDKAVKEYKTYKESLVPDELVKYT
ncbi:MAG: hypothetical protein HGB12_03715, partial [Bacteroidetes bacterium]|nr:hypothetical protein [Bacteroidota bacterium]